MGYLPGFATPRMICDVPYVGKRWVHQVSRYDTEPRHLLLDQELPDPVEAGDALALSREYPYYDPIYLLPARARSGGAARRPGHTGRGRRRPLVSYPESTGLPIARAYQKTLPARETGARA